MEEESFDNYLMFLKNMRKINKIRKNQKYPSDGRKVSQRSMSIIDNIADERIARIFYISYIRYDKDFLIQKTEKLSESFKNYVLELIDKMEFLYVEDTIDVFEFMKDQSCENYYDVIEKFIPFTENSIEEFIGLSSGINNLDAIKKCLKTMVLYYNRYMYYNDKFDDYYLQKVIDIIKSSSKHNIAEKVEVINYLTKSSKIFAKKSNLEIDGSTFPSKITENDIECPEDGEILIPWKFVKFMNGYFFIYHPKHVESCLHRPYRCDDINSKKAFNDISSVFVKKLPDIIANCKNGKITRLINIGNITECVNVLDRMTNRKYENKTSEEIVKDEIKKRNELDYDSVMKIIKEKKSEYLDYLAANHIDRYKVCYCLEIRRNSNDIDFFEDAFIFIIGEYGNEYVVVYENSLESRASIVFYVDRSRINDATNGIHEFFASSTNNKRYQIQSSAVDLSEYGITKYERVIHDDINTWKNCIKILSNR